MKPIALRWANFLLSITTLCFLPRSTSFSTSPPPRDVAASARDDRPDASSPPLPFHRFEFDPSTGICRRPASFRRRLPNPAGRQNREEYFVLRNVPGDGDCVFHAVLSSVFVSMGMLRPDAAASSSSSSSPPFSSALSAMALEMRRVVANVLSSPDGNLYVGTVPADEHDGQTSARRRRRLVRCRDLLRSASRSEGLSPEDYLRRLRTRGREGGLHGGGAELTVLSNLLRRPISVYHLKGGEGGTGGRGEVKEDVCDIELVGVFGEGLFEDPCGAVPDGVVANAVFF
ncbi:hypothetical protein ACHAXS_000187, partial [Conticribra weissflogii]